VTIINATNNRLIHDIATCLVFVSFGITTDRTPEVIAVVIDSFKPLYAVRN
jgi:hypothetical protein